MSNKSIEGLKNTVLSYAPVLINFCRHGNHVAIKAVFLFVINIWLWQTLHPADMTVL